MHLLYECIMQYNSTDIRMASYSIGPEDVCLWYSDTHLRLPDFRKTLQRQDFPRATRTLLEWLHRYFVQCENFPPGKFPNQDSVRQLIEEFVFYRNSGTSRVQQKPTAIQELRLLEELCNLFQLNQDLITRDNVFDAFFGCKPGPISAADEHRTAALSKLVSMAIAVNCIPVLECAGVLMHNQGTTEATLGLTRSIVQDYCILIPSASSRLRELMESSPRFVCSLVSSVSALYDVDKDSKKPSLPPLSLLEVLASWISVNPKILIEHIINVPPRIPSFRPADLAPDSPLPSRLPGPLPGLIKACIVSPFLAPKTPFSSTDVVKDSSSPHLLYSRLHLGILQAVLAIQSYSRSEGLVSLRHIQGIVTSLKRLLGGARHDDETVDVVLDRLAQVVQVASSVRMLHCSRSALKTTFDGLPSNQLLSLVLQHEGSIQS